MCLMCKINELQPTPVYRISYTNAKTEASKPSTSTLQHPTYASYRRRYQQAISKATPPTTSTTPPMTPTNTPPAATSTPPPPPRTTPPPPPPSTTTARPYQLEDVPAEPQVVRLQVPMHDAPDGHIQRLAYVVFYKWLRRMRKGREHRPHVSGT